MYQLCVLSSRLHVIVSFLILSVENLLPRNLFQNTVDLLSSIVTCFVNGLFIYHFFTSPVYLGGITDRCMPVILMHPAKAVGWNEMPFDRDTHVVPSDSVLDRGPGHPTGRGDLGVGTPVKICTANCGQTVTDSGMWLWTAYRNSTAPYPTVPSPTPIWLPLPQTTCSQQCHIMPNDFAHCCLFQVSSCPHCWCLWAPCLTVAR